MSTIEERVMMVVLSRMPTATSNSTFEELGADSLEKMELVMDLEDEFYINIPDNKYSSVQTVGDIVRMLEERCDQANEECE